MINKKINFIIFGISGDLAKRKLLPGIYGLIRDKKITNFQIIGIGRRKIPIHKIINDSKKFITKPNSQVLRKLEKNSIYLQLNLSKSEDYKKLQDTLKKEKHNEKIFHFATASEMFPIISSQLSRHKIVDKQSKLIFEKPFGHNLKSAKKINKEILKNFNENQIYRIDHYLGKELVTNILFLRFENTFLEPIWNNKYIQEVQIILDENMGVMNRGAYYDKYGAIKDVFQNHILQLISLIAMEQPKVSYGKSIRDKKLEAIKKIKVKDTLLGQYDGYLKEKNIKEHSRTETFIAAKLFVNSRRWRNVPFFVRTGKQLNEKATRIIIKFKIPKCILFKNCSLKSNTLVIEIEPNESIYFEMNSKIPGVNSTSIQKMNFCHSCVYGPNTPDAYQNLFEQAISSDHSAFVRNDEIEAAWKVVDKMKARKLYKYKIKSKGPKEVENFNKRNKIVWG